MWHEQLFNILNIINNVILTLIGVPFTIQMIYTILGWLKKKTFIKTTKKNRICVLIPAHNESDVIYDTVKRIYDRQKYPKELFDVYVVADNCTDNTAELARSAGAIVFIHNDPDPKHHIALYAIKFGYEEILKLEKKYDFSIRLDADNFINDEFFGLMNDCFNAGIEMARPYESSLNITQNNYTKASGLYYAFDSRFASRVRERLGIDAHVNGPGSMISMGIISKFGYSAKGIVDDAEFTNKMMLEGYRLHYVEDAVVYEDVASTFKDTYAKNKRMGSGVSRLFFTDGLKMLGKFFVTFRFSYLEMFLQYLFCMICILLCTWIPAFYIYDVVYTGLCGAGIIGTTLFDSAYYNQVFITTLIVIACCLTFLFVFVGLLQAFILVMVDYKKLGVKSRKELISGIFIYPCFSVVYILTLCLGIFSKPKWVKVNRNKVKTKD